MATKPFLFVGKTLPAALLALPVFLPLLLSIAPVSYAQEAEEEAQLERFQVTGSRIRRATLEGVSPVFTLNRDDIERTGLTSVGDILQELTTGGSALNTRINSSGNFGFPPTGEGTGAGASTVNLRHLGAKRTLVLVDGQRWVQESSASGVSSVVDLNTIPLDVIERIEILEDGASAVYGTDAIGGVVNIITRKDFEGARTTAYYGQFDEGDGETFRGDASFGVNTDRISMFLSASYTDQQRISSGDRPISSFPVPGTGLTRGSSATPRGRFIFTDPASGETFNLTLKNAVSGVPRFDPADPFGPNSDFEPFTTDDRFNFAPFNLLLTPSERFSIFGQVFVNLTDDVRLYVRGLFNSRESVNQAAPEPIFLGPLTGNGNLADVTSIDVTNPFNPFGIPLDAESNFLLLGRRPLEAGPRIFEQDVDTRHIAAGFEGNFNVRGRAFFWDVNFIDAENEANQFVSGTFNIRKINQALGPIDQCLGDPFSGCVPLDLFSGAGGGAGITQDMLDFIIFPEQDESQQELQVASLNISGDLFDLPAGKVGIAVGFEHRELDGFFQPDAVIVAGDTNGVPASPTSGGFNVEEVYGELVIPVLSDLPLIQNLEITGAVRYSDFSTFGGETTAKAGIRWQVTDDFLMRATYAEGLRAPAIGELFGTESRFDATLADPCSDFLGRNLSQEIIDNCIALGVPADGSFVQPNPQIAVVTGGNPNLNPENSDSWNAGFVYSPSWAEDSAWASRLDIGFSYYRHELDGAIQSIRAQTQLDACVADPTSGFCEGISRNFTGAINNFQNRLTNIGGISTEGIDINIDWTSPETGFGRFHIDWRSTYVFNFTETLISPGDPDGILKRSLEGIEENDRAIPELQSNLIFGWNMGDWSASWTVRFVDSVTEECSDDFDGTDISLTAFGLCSDPNFENEDLSRNKLDSEFYNDIQVTWHAAINDRYGFTISGGAKNLFGNNPPECFSCSLNGFDVTTHDLPGQFWYFRAAFDF